MAAYRFYMLNAQGRIYKAEIIEAEDDSTAIAAADRLQEAHRLPGYEIWMGRAASYPNWATLLNRRTFRRRRA